MDGSQDPIRWLDKPQTTRRIFFGLIVVDVILVVVGELIHKHGHFDVEYSVPAFYAIFGFFAYCSIIAGAVMLRKAVKRREDYYDE
jgi:hypothetical protein